MDPRLRWQQLVAPDLSAASAAVARAGQSFNRGLETASGVLERYNAGQQEQADAALLSDLAGLGSEEEFDAFIDGGGLQGRNISSAMRDHVLGARTGFVRDAGVRANTQGTLARTAIAQAAEGRNAANFAYEDGRRRELAGLSGLIVGASQEGNQFGRQGSPVEATGDVRMMLARTLQAEAGNQGFDGMLDVGSVIRNRAATGRYGEGIEGVIMRPGQFSAWNSVTGYAGGEQGQDMSFTPNDEALAAADAILSGNYRDRTGGATHYYANIPGVSGVPSWSNGSFRQIDGDHFFGVAEGEGADGNTGPVAGYQRPQFDRLQAALGGSQYLSPGDVQGLLAGAYQAQEIGQTRLDAAEAARIQAASDAAVLGAFNDPTVLGSDPASILAAAQGAGLDDGATLDLLGRIQGAAAANPGIFNPQAPEDPLLAAAQEARAAEAARLAANDPQQRLIAEGARYNDDPIAALTERFDLDLDLAGREDLNGAINNLADGLRITRGEAAVALAESYSGEPGFFQRDILSNRFDSEAAVRFARDTFGPEARIRAGDGAAISARDAAQTEGATARLQQLQSQALRFQAAGREVPPEIAREITGLQDTLRAGTSPQAVQQELQTYIARTGMASRLDGLDPESPEFFRAIADLESAIQADRSLDADQKRLLLSALRG